MARHEKGRPFSVYAFRPDVREDSRARARGLGRRNMRRGRLELARVYEP